MEDKNIQILNVINILLILASVLITITLLTRNDPWIFILLYWTINTIKAVYFIKEDIIIKQTLISLSALFICILLVFHFTPWPGILTFWICIHLAKNKPHKIDAIFIHILTFVAILVNMTYLFSIDSWFVMTIYWSITMLRCPILLKEKI